MYNLFYLSLHLQKSNNTFGAIAQLVEQRTENPCVTGSIPVGTTKKETHMSLFFCVQSFSGFGIRLTTPIAPFLNVYHSI